ncbi:MAG: hypothetical protein HY222_04935 [Thaumarchaeota archaeon]|nr:hypothetical protein [Nitrososphaerota archaeon]MBI3641720.1 hypothetical protein [Nitrososphaerota archaeon]
MKTLAIIIAAATIAVIASVSFFSQIQYDNKIPCTFCPEDRSPNQSLQILDITTEPSIIHIGTSFLIYADVSNQNPYSIYLNGGCVSPISATFDKNVETKNGITCFAMSNEEIKPEQQTRIHGPSIGTTYNATSIGLTNAVVTFTYQAQGKTETVKSSMQIRISSPSSTPSQIVDQLRLARTGISPVNSTAGIRLDCKNPIGIQMQAVNESVNQTKAIALAYTSQEFLNEIHQYGNVYYNSFFNDWITGDPCNTIWQDVEVVFTGYDKNGLTRNIQVTEDVDLTKVLNVTDYASGYFK